MLFIYKPVGISPLDCIKHLQDKFEIYRQDKLSYAGRLDPMAEGLVLLLQGDENKRRDQFLKLDKKYDVEMVLGIETDSYDVLGIPRKGLQKDVSRKILEEILKNFIGTIQQAYPPFSSKTYKGKPLFWWMRQNRIHEIDIPSEKRIIYDIELVGVEKISALALQTAIQQKLNLVRGDFRQDQIKTIWQELFGTLGDNNEFTKIALTVHCSSGTYIRTLVHDVGEKLKTGAIVFSLKRTAIGNYSRADLDLRGNVL